MGEFSPLQEEILNDFFAMHRLVHRDTEIALRLTRQKMQALQDGSLDFQEGYFWVKTFIRSLLGEVDAMGFVLRQSVVKGAPELCPDLPSRDLAKVSERRYDRENDRVTDEPVRPLSTLDSLKLGLRFFPRLFGAEWTPDFKRPGWQALDKLAKARHQFTHPNRLERVMPSEAFVFLEPAFFWYGKAMMKLLGECVKQVDPSMLSGKDDVDPDGVTVPNIDFPKATDILDKEFYGAVEGSLGHSFGYVTHMFKHLAADTGRSLELIKDLPEYRGKTPQELERSDEYQFTIRNLIRTLFSEVEGTIGYIEFLLSSAGESGQLNVSETELEALRTGEIEERLIAALNLWSAKLGSGATVSTQEDGWEAFVLAKTWRNKVTHPTQTMDFLLLPSVMKKIQEGAWWFLLDAREVLEIELDRLPGGED